MSDEKFTEGTYKGTKYFSCDDKRAVFTTVNDLIPLNTFNRLYDRMNSITVKYENLILEKEKLTSDKEILTKENQTLKSNLDKVSKDKQAMDNELIKLKDNVATLQKENETLSSQNSNISNMLNDTSKERDIPVNVRTPHNPNNPTASSNNAELQVERHIMKIQELEAALETVVKENDNYQTLMAYYDELTTKKETEINKLRESMQIFVEENDRVRKEYADMNVFLENNYGNLNVQKDKLETNYSKRIEYLKEENDRLTIENERFVGFAHLGLIENSRFKMQTFKSNFFKKLCSNFNLFKNLEYMFALERIVQYKEYCLNYIFYNFLNKNKVKHENVSDIDNLKKFFRLYNSIAKNFCFSFYLEWQLGQITSLDQFKEFTTKPLYKLVMGTMGLIYNKDIDYKTNLSELIERWELHILKEDFDDETREHPWMILLRFLFNMMYVLKIYQHLQTDGDNNFYKAVFSFREVCEQLNIGLAVDFNKEKTLQKLEVCNSIYEFFKRVIQSKFTDQINFDIELFKGQRIYNFDELIRFIYSYVSYFKDHAKSNFAYISKESYKEVKLINEFIIQYTHFIDNATSIEEKYNALSTTTLDYGKNIEDLREDIKKKAKSIENLTREREEALLNMAKSEERSKDLRRELDKIRESQKAKKSKDKVFKDSASGVKYIKYLHYYMDKYTQEKLRNIKSVMKDRRVVNLMGIKQETRNANIRSRVLRQYEENAHWIAQNVQAIDCSKDLNQCLSDHYGMVRSLAKNKCNFNDIMRSAVNVSEMNTNPVLGKNDNELGGKRHSRNAGTLTFGTGSVVKQVYIDEYDFNLLNSVVL